MPSSSISCFRVPPSSSWREMLSSQIDWPAASISCRWFVMSVSFCSEGRLEGEHLVESALMALRAREARAEEAVDQLEREPGADHPLAEADHVGVVVFPALACAERVVADRRAHAADLVGRDRRA